RQRLGQQRLARAGRTDQQDVRFGQFDFILARTRFHALVVVVDRHCERLLGARLPDDVLVEYVHDFLGLGQMAAGTSSLLLEFLADDVVAEFDALVANEDAGTSDQLADFVLTFAAERAVQDLVAVARSALPVVAHAVPRFSCKYMSVGRIAQPRQKPVSSGTPGRPLVCCLANALIRPFLRYRRAAFRAPSRPAHRLAPRWRS